MLHKAKKRGHRLFARNYDRSVALFEQKFGPKYRGELLRYLHGAVLEIGIGTGANFPYYSRQNLSELIGIEPDAYMLEQAQAKKKALGLNIQLLDASVQALPFANAQFDAVVSTLVLCSVPNPAGALAEIRRVLKSDGKLYLFEHVGSLHPFGRSFQIVLNPLWGLAAGGCQLTRNTATLVEQAGFHFEQLEWLRLIPLNPINPQIWGIASPSSNSKGE